MVKLKSQMFKIYQFCYSRFADEPLNISEDNIQNKPYKTLIVDTGCLDWSNYQLIDKYSTIELMSYLKEKLSIVEKKEWYALCIINNIPANIKENIILYASYVKSISTILSKFNISRL